MKKFINKSVISKGQIQMNSYYQLPKEILDNEKYSEMKANSMKLYIKLFDLTKVSIRNGWIDDNGNYFVKFSQLDSKNKIGMAQNTFRGAKKELIELGLLVEKKQPKGLPSILYVQLPTSESVVEENNTEDKFEAPEDVQENMMDNTQIGLEESSNDFETNSKQNGFGIHEINSSEIEKIVNNNEPLNDREKVYVKTDQFGKIIEVYRYDKGVKDDLFKWAERLNKNICEYLDMVEKKHGATINYL